MGKHGTRSILLCIVAAAAGFFCFRKYGGVFQHRASAQEILLPNAAAREAWLNLYGWEVSAVSESPMQIPSDYRTAVGSAWEAMQEAQGISPLRYGGQAAVRCLYHIENLCDDTFYAELWICGDALAGAMVYNAETQEMCRVK